MAGFAVALVVVLMSVGIHYEGLRLCSRLLGSATPRRRYSVALAMLGALAAHFVEIVVFALASGLMISQGLGGLEPPQETFEDLLYVSAVNYTSLGFGDVVPTGPMRHLASLEALTGLVMIAWTASFSFLQMEHFWGER